MAAINTKLSLEDTTNEESEDAKTISIQKEDVTITPKKEIEKDHKVQRKDAKCPKHTYDHTFGIEKETAASTSDKVTGTHTYPQPAAAELRYLHVGDHVVVYSGHESEDTYGYTPPENVSTGHSRDSLPVNYEKPEDVQEYKMSENIIMRQSDWLPSGNYEEPEEAHGYKETENMSKVQGEGTSSYNYEEPEDFHEYKEAENMSKVHGEDSPSEEPEDAHEYKEAENMRRGHSEDSPSHYYVEPEDPHEYKMPENVNMRNDKDSSSNVYEEAEDAHGYDPEGASFVFKARDLDECIKNPCQHGTCVNQDVGYNCTCSPGWTGQNCQEDINECATHPCQHGRCENQDGGYKCTCSDGWTGKNCHEARRCKSGWTEYNNNCYKLFKNMVNWPTANSKCKQRGANLAFVTSAEENKFVARLISDAPPRYIRHLVYFGLKREGGRWEWTDGSPLSYTNWAPGEPGKNIWGKTGHCGNMYSKESSNILLGAKGKRGQWNDHICSWKLPYVCKTPK
ncbi:PREDICTED: neurocan core protein-like [Branchiostoma belcheri]|uniref:Neurocan core protein-like n=1 Tax=Branchiostoma belcheri TaxID=7741 RepID=A0A6P4YNK4_BRABE|nr:PREDICTED: neurocan core protein-like [Branchiostoma belcheri]